MLRRTLSAKSTVSSCLRRSTSSTGARCFGATDGSSTWRADRRPFVARRPIQTEQSHPTTQGGAPSTRWEGRLEIIIAIALGLAAVVTAGAVYLNEHQEHKANLDFHQATHRLLDATAAGIRTPAGRALEASSAREILDAENHQDKAANYTLAEVILATSLFLFGIAAIISRWRIKIGSLSIAAGIFVVALVVLATV